MVSGSHSKAYNYFKKDQHLARNEFVAVFVALASARWRGA